MSNEELKEALINRRPIIACIPSMGEIEYAYVSRSSIAGMNVAASTLAPKLWINAYIR